MSDLNQLERRLGYTFRDPLLLQEALTHSSVSREKLAAGRDNQRLEFLGDAVLQLILTDALFRSFTEAGEGPLTKARAQMVNRKTLAQQGRRLQLGDTLVLSRGEEASGGRGKQSVIADSYEAVIGAIYLDGGYEAARDFVLREFGDAFGEVDVIPNLENPKGELQEILQRRSREAPCYHVTSATGPDHQRVFECAVVHQGQELGRGSGGSKKLAESRAAQAALEALRSA